MNATRLISPLALCALLGCATQNSTGPIAKTVCVSAPQQSASETEYLLRAVKKELNKNGFQLASENCDVFVKYTKIGGFAGSSTQAHAFGRSTNANWSQEGMLSLQHQKRTIIEDKQLNLRGYASKLDLLGELAWYIVDPVNSHFRSPVAQRD